MRISDWSSDVCSSDLLGDPHRIESEFFGVDKVVDFLAQETRVVVIPAALVGEATRQTYVHRQCSSRARAGAFSALLPLAVPFVAHIPPCRNRLSPRRAASVRRRAKQGGRGALDRKSTRLNS